MRITSGNWRGKSLKTPKGLDIRPTADVVKQALFNIIAPKLNNAHVLDLFAGTGQLGLEALSRGAAHACFVDKGRQSLQILQENIKSLNAENISEVLPLDFNDAMAGLGRRGDRFDVIIADPPYQANLYTQIMQNTVQYNLLKPDGLLVLEHDSADALSVAEGLELISQRKYGRRSLMILSAKEEAKQS